MFNTLCLACSSPPSPPLPLRAKLRRLPCVRISWASLNPSMFCFQTTHQWSTRANILCIGINICGKLEWKQRSWTWHHLIPEPTANGNFIGFGVSQWQQLSSSVKWRICFTKEKRRRTKKKANNKNKRKHTIFRQEVAETDMTGFFTGVPSGGGLGASRWCYKSLSGN